SNILGGTTSLTITAGTGIGTNSDDIDTTVANITLTNNTSGDIYLQETDTLEIKGITQNSSDGVINIVVDSGDITQSGNITSVNGDISVIATSGSIIMNDIKETNSTAGNITYNASSNVEVAIINTTGNVTVIAGLAISDNLSSENANITANEATLSATTGIGTNSDEIDTDVSTISLTNITSGDIFLEEDDDLIISSINSQGTNGDVVIVTEEGTITTTGTITTNTSSDGDILLQAIGTASDITIGAALLSTGNVSLNAGRSVNLNANVTTSTSSKTIDVLANNSITMIDGTTIQTNDGNIIIEATNGSVTTDSVNAGTADVGIYAGTTLSDIDGSSLITANELLIKTGSTIGEGSNHLNTAVDEITVNSGSDVYITEANAIEVNSVDVEVNRVDVTGVATLTTSYDTQSDITTGGSLVLEAGAMTVSETIVVEENVLLKSSDTIILNSDLTSTSGNITLDATNNLELNADVKAVVANKTIELNAGNNIIMATDTLVSVENGGNILFDANNDVTIETIDAKTSSVSITAGGNLIDTDEQVDIIASSLLLDITGAVGSVNNHLETNIDTLSAKAGNGLFITETNTVSIDSVTVNVNSVNNDGTTTVTTNEAQENLVSTDKMILVSTQGDIDITEGAVVFSNSDTLIKSTNGNVVLSSELNTLGNLSIQASNSFTQNANVIATGTVDVEATTITMGTTASTDAKTSNIRYNATGVLTLGELVTTNDVSLKAGSIVDSNADTTNVTADELRVETTGSIAEESNKLETNVAKLSSVSNGLFIVEADDLIIGQTSKIAVQRVDEVSNLSVVEDSIQGNISSNSDVFVKAINGNITMEDDSSINATGSNATLEASGTIFLELINAQNVSIKGANLVDIDLDADTLLDIISSSLVLDISNDIGTTTNFIETNIDSIDSNSNNLYLDELNDLVVNSIISNVAHIHAGNITDLGTDISIVATELTVNANEIGEIGNHLNTDVDTMNVTVAN
ncbi:beta strand repeat-containing protein, partial [Arcobacter sp. YIC-464]|uniref:beta strand repeat-containing protein n=1 Tax=Arcobacter sp. YIC-464 TaxID=3376631 RepID=UPI003C2B456B